jgi:hypothetical protein
MDQMVSVTHLAALKMAVIGTDQCAKAGQLAAQNPVNRDGVKILTPINESRPGVRARAKQCGLCLCRGVAGQDKIWAQVYHQFSQLPPVCEIA